MRVDRRRRNPAPDELKPESFLQRMRAWLRTQAPHERYLADAADHADLERRIRNLERADPGPAVVTFNH